MPPRGVKSSKRKRQYEHIKESELDRGVGEGRAEEIAARTVNKQRAQAGETKSARGRSSKSTGSRKSAGGRKASSRGSAKSSRSSSAKTSSRSSSRKSSSKTKRAAKKR